MNTFETNIQNLLTDTDRISYFEEFAEKNPGFTYPVNNYPVGIEKTLTDFHYVKDILLDSIENGVFESLPIPLQFNFNNNITTMFNSPRNQNQFTVSVQQAYHQVVVSGLEFKLNDLEKFRATLKDVSNVKRSYSALIKKLDETKAKVDEIKKLNNQSNKVFEELKEKNETSIKTVDSTIQGLRRIEEITESVKQHNQVVENAKKEVVAFKENVDSFKTDINNSTAKTKAIIEDFENKREKVADLIEQSEKALKLKSSEGMSAALSAQYEEEGKIEKRRQWLIGAIIFIALTLFGLSLLIFKLDFFGANVDPDSPNAIIARIVFVGVTIAAASFAAKQYLNQKRLADNYGYKLVLAKSIVAFAEEIKKHDPEKAAEYMTNVLNELNKSPIEKENSGDVITKSNVNLLERLQSLFKPS
ncbi:hypothetical protein [Christiangramia sp. SM2212]|uniref:Uncharacterized protein n=1 Tax=Christiangramia sediminicola TaxID=3073267 RepID=A0ABU1EU36_9FLAO|nr:hypothetical protein [Christiangramia sp. SM2212]MDR5591897.1 hypothetical protein [Christiangramia sp. SM2212]